ncbi:unnamed protein product [Knipowitschia caucasica]|uniref:Interleukin n=1 Tax=Knipowitschia caucasica TaxID=637954 RepID=A0AAV2J3Q5_KNICA
MRGVRVRLLLLWLSFTTTFVSLEVKRCGSEDGLVLIENITARQPDWGADTQLYTPTEQQIEDCKRSALKCMSKEVEALLEEWTINERDLVRTFRTLAKKTQNQKESCDPCEKFTVQPALTFLQFLTDTLQKINTLCKSRGR